jgi:teichuronic acid biosynthesis glycosyltransferase TuaH
VGGDYQGRGREPQLLTSVCQRPPRSRRASIVCVFTRLKWLLLKLFRFSYLCGALVSVDSERHVIWLSGQSWDCVSGSDRNMAVALSQIARILWIDAPLSPANRARDRVGYPPLRPRIYHLSDRITRLSTLALPGLTRPGVRATTASVVRAQISWAIRHLGYKPAAVVMGYLGDLLGGWGDGVVNVLYGTDDWVAGAELTGVSARHLRLQEHRALARADVIVAVTPQLAARWSALGASPTVIPNGCWLDEGEVPQVPTEVANLPKPVIGLLGYLGNRVDIEVLLAVADAGYSLLLVGAKDPHWEQGRFRELISRPHVRYVGGVPSSEVRRYLAAFDVGIVPYRDTEFNRASFPLKTLEYLSAGVPAVSANLPAARWLCDGLQADELGSPYGRILMLADRTYDYLRAISALLENKQEFSPDAISKSCVAFAEKHSWSRRAEDLGAAIGLI